MVFWVWGLGFGLQVWGVRVELSFLITEICCKVALRGGGGVLMSEVAREGSR